MPIAGKLFKIRKFCGIDKNLFFLLFLRLMYQQNCIQNHFWFLYDKLNWLFCAVNFIKQQFLTSKQNKMSCLSKYCIKLSFVCVKKTNCMRWYSLLFSIILGFVIPNSSNHCTRQRIFIMYSYVCILFYFCVRQNFVCHTKQVTSVSSHHRPAKGSSVVSPLSIIPSKSIVLPLSISPPTHADSPSHITRQTVNQPREEVLCLCRWSGQSYREKASCRRRWSVRPGTLTRRRT